MIRRNVAQKQESSSQHSNNASIHISSELLSLSQHVRTFPSPKIPQHFPYKHPSTLWLLSNLSSENGLRRILLKNREQEFLSCRFFQVPDKPSLHMQSSLENMEQSAFSDRTLLYLTPIAITVYLKQNRALETMLRNFSPCERKIYSKSINQPGYVMTDQQHPSDDDDVSNFNIGVLAILRMNVDALIILMNYGVFDPHEEFFLMKIQRNDETIYYYRDILDYMVYLLRRRPCFPVANVIQQILDMPWRFACSNELLSGGFRLHVFEKLSNSSEIPSEDNCVSIIRRILLLALDQNYFAHEVGSSILNLLEVLVKTNYFTLNSSSLRNVECSDTERSIIMTNKITLYSDIHAEDSDKLFHGDSLRCIGLLILWFQNCLEEFRESHSQRIVDLITRILLDTRSMHILFEENDDTLTERFSIIDGLGGFQKTKLLCSTFRDLRTRIFDVIRQNKKSKRKFLKMCNFNRETRASTEQADNSRNFISALADSTGNRDIVRQNSRLFNQNKPDPPITLSNSPVITQNNLRTRNGRFACITMQRTRNVSKLEDNIKDISGLFVLNRLNDRDTVNQSNPKPLSFGNEHEYQNVNNSTVDTVQTSTAFRERNLAKNGESRENEGISEFETALLREEFTMTYRYEARNHHVPPLELPSSSEEEVELRNRPIELSIRSSD